MIHGHAERRADFVLPRVELADTASVVIDGAHDRLQRTLDRFGHPDDFGFVLGQRENGDFNWRHRVMKFENDARLAFVIRLFRVRIHQKRQHGAIHASRGFNDVGIEALFRRFVKVRQVFG